MREIYTREKLSFFFLFCFAIISRTKFELKVDLESDAHLRIRQMSLDLSSPNHIPLNARIAEFCEDPQNMDQMTEFVDDILKKAQIEADARLEQKNKVIYSIKFSLRIISYRNYFLSLPPSFSFCFSLIACTD